MTDHTHKATVLWRRSREEDFPKGRYSRAHVWKFDGGIEVPGSSSPLVVPLPYSSANAIDPEEAFVASLSSCHMLTFLDLVRRAGFVVESYEDEAVGVLTKNDKGRLWISEVTLCPRIAFGEEKPTAGDLDRLHKGAHDGCFIASSVLTKVTVAAPVDI